MKKTQKGITLIALIITIVVLLILAGVAIGAMEESSIIPRSQEAASKFEEAKNNELDVLKSYEDLLNMEKVRAYGTEEVYALESGNSLIFVFNIEDNNKGIYVTTIKDVNTFLSGLTEGREDYENYKKSAEEKYNAKATGFPILKGEDGENPLGVILGDKILVGPADGQGKIIELNDSLTEKLARDKSTYTCYKMDLLGSEAITGVDFKNKIIESVTLQNGAGNHVKFEAQTGKTENEITIEVLGGEPNEEIDLPVGTEYIYYIPEEGGDAVVYISAGDILLYTTSVPTEDGSAMKFTKANESDIIKLGVYYK